MAGYSRTQMEYRVFVRREDGAYWAEVAELPGCFASGRTLDELKDAVVEAITLYVDDGSGHGDALVEEMRVLIPS